MAHTDGSTIYRAMQKLVLFCINSLKVGLINLDMVKATIVKYQDNQV